jgi:uncharacterized protein
MSEAAPHVWYELLTADIAAARNFYREVVGWEIAGESAMPADTGMDYRMIARTNGQFAGGAMELTPEMVAGGAKPCWLGYIYVPDVDAEVARIEAEGGAVHMPAVTMDDVGRMAMVADPWGATYYVMTPMPPAGMEDAEPDVFTVDQPQTIRWNELVTPEPEAAIAFYTGHYGWRQEGTMPMGPLGDYSFLHAGETGIGAVMRQADFMHPGWTYYIGVDDIDRAMAAVSAGGGTLMGEAMEIPGGEFTVHITDPQGAYVGLVGPRHG